MFNPFVGAHLEAPGPCRRAASRRPEVSRRPLPSARLPSPPRSAPLRAASGLPARAAGRRTLGAAPPNPPRWKEQSREPEAGLGSYLDDPARQPGHLVRYQVRPLVLSPAPLASRTSGSPGLHFRGTLPRPPPPPPPPPARPLGKCSPCSGASGLPSDLGPPAPLSPPQPRPGGGGSDAQRRGRDLGEVARGGADLRRL